jgi:hypothetical protein
MEPSCTHGCDTDTRTLFCPRCGKLLDPDGLRAVRIDGFTGAQSLSPGLEKFWASGDPQHLTRR